MSLNSGWKTDQISNSQLVQKYITKQKKHDIRDASLKQGDVGSILTLDDFLIW